MSSFRRFVPLGICHCSRIPGSGSRRISTRAEHLRRDRLRGRRGTGILSRERRRHENNDERHGVKADG